MDTFQVLKLLSLSVMLQAVVLAETSVELTECQRGVRRHHPTQANVYQVFSRQDYRKQWISYSCPQFEVFDPSICRCVSLPPSKERVESGQDWTVRYQGGRRPTTGEERPVGQRGDNQGRADAKDGAGDLPRSSQQRVVSYRERILRPAPQSTEEDGDALVDPNCQLHRATGNPAIFERWSDGSWVEEDCNWPFYTGLVWSQEDCRCEWGPNRTLAKPVSKDDGVPASCLMMLRMSFDSGSIRDEGRNIWLNVRNRDSAGVEEDQTAVGGYAGSFRGSSVVVPYFKSNVLGDTFHVGFRFKLCPGEPDTDIVLLHNDCPEADDGASLVISYQAWTRRMTVALRTINTNELLEDSCILQSQPTQWTQVDVRYGDSLLDISINSQVCAQSDKHYGLMSTNNCPLTLLGEAFCGGLDEVIITRGCTEAHAIS